jgi:hypothetical protein
MSTQFNRFPTYQQPLATKGETTRGWYTFFSGLFAGQPTAPVMPIMVTSAPFIYVAPTGGSLIVQGGTTSQIQFSRDGMNFYVLGVTSGVIPLSQADQVVITYSVAPPTVTWVPR